MVKTKANKISTPNKALYLIYCFLKPKPCSLCKAINSFCFLSHLLETPRKKQFNTLSAMVLSLHIQS